MLSLLASSAAFSKDVGLIAVFGGIGVLVNVILIFILVEVRGESQENRRRLAEHRDRRV